MTKSELAYGYNVTRRTLYNWIKKSCDNKRLTFDFIDYRHIGRGVLPPKMLKSIFQHLGEPEIIGNM